VHYSAEEANVYWPNKLIPPPWVLAEQCSSVL